MTLVVSLGLFHGLIVLPIIFSWIPLKKKLIKKINSPNYICKIIVNGSQINLNSNSMNSFNK